MKKLVIAVLAVVLLIFCASCSKDKDTEVPDGMLQLENEAVYYNFYYPEDWTVDRNDGMVSVRVSEKDRSSVSVTTSAASNDVLSVDSYLTTGDKTYLENMRESFPDFKIVSGGEEGEAVKLGGVDARQFVFTASFSGETYKFRQIIVYSLGNVYILTYTSTEEMFDTHTEDVNKIVSEFRFK